MSQINVRNLSNENDDGAPDIVGVSTFSATSYFVPPVGTTKQRPDNPQPGDLRFNTDSVSLEYFRGDTLGWSQIEMTSPVLGGGTGSNAGAGVRMVLQGAFSPAWPGKRDYLTISTLGNAVDFGDMLVDRGEPGCFGSRTRGINAGGSQNGSPHSDDINYFNYATVGSATDFGNLINARSSMAALSDNTRGMVTGGRNSGDENNGNNWIDYITISATGNAVDFGDMNTSGVYMAGCSSSTRGVINIGKSGVSPSTVKSNIMEYLTISTTGNTTDFGDNDTDNIQRGSCSNSIRGLVFGGYQPGPTTYKNEISYFTIATTGNGADFGDLPADNVTNGSTGASSPTRAVIAGGYFASSPNTTNAICYVEIATTGNAVDFGDLAYSTITNGLRSSSNGHGGL